jgi:hypothetical protein
MRCGIEEDNGGPDVIHTMRPYQTMSAGRLAFVLAGIVLLLGISIAAFTGNLPHGTVSGWVGVLALIAYASLMFF